MRARYLDHQARWRDELAAVLTTRTGAGPDDFRPVLTASIALAAFTAAQARWADLDGAPSFVAMLDEAFNAARAAVQNP